MKITKEQIKQLVIEEINSIVEESDKLEKIVQVPGYGMLKIGQIQKGLARRLSTAANMASGDTPKYSLLPVICAFYKALKDNDALNINLDVMNEENEE